MRRVVNLQPGSRAAHCYGADRATEQYYCNFGLNSAYRQTLEEGGLHVSGIDDDNEPRVFELPGHPFYIATLFVPQNRSTLDSRLSTLDEPHPLVTALLAAAANGQPVERPDQPDTGARAQS